SELQGRRSAPRRRRQKLERDFGPELRGTRLLIAVDTNILVYAHREEAPFHAVGERCMTDLAESRSAWAIPWPCVHEFLGVVTNRRIYRTPTPLPVALNQI